MAALPVKPAAAPLTSTMPYWRSAEPASNEVCVMAAMMSAGASPLPHAA
jgi:hypothetical protein